MVTRNRRPTREPYHTLCRPLSTLVNSGVKCQYCRCPPPPIGQLDTKQTKNLLLIEFKG